jgi:hypothetical protein
MNASFVYMHLFNRRRCTCTCIDFVGKGKDKDKGIHDDEQEDKKGQLWMGSPKESFCFEALQKRVIPVIPGTPFPEAVYVGVVLWW